MDIKRVVELLVRKYGTRDPIRIASLMGILIEYRNLKGIWGYFQMYSRIPVIHIAYGLPENLILFVIAHELAHRILHPDVNVPFLRANTLQSIDKIERQANQFAVELMIPDKLLFEGMTIYEAADACGVPEEVSYLKKLPGKAARTHLS